MGLFVNIVEGGAGEAAFAERHGISAAKRYICLDPQPDYSVKSIPHVTVIHRGGMVVRNGSPGTPGFPDAIEPLVKAMVEESAESGAEEATTVVEEAVAAGESKEAKAKEATGPCNGTCVLL